MTKLLLFILCTAICSAQTDFWQPATGPQDGQIDILARDSSGGIYAVHQSSPVIYHSIDEGRSWAPLPTPTGTVSSLAIGADGRLIATQGSSGSGTIQGLVVSDDRGLTWDTLHKTAVSPHAATVAPDGTIFFVSASALLRRISGQQNWTTHAIVPAGVGPSTSMIRGVVLSAGGDLFAATEVGVYRSTDRGTTWTDASSGLADSVIRAVVAAGGDLYATGRDSTIYRSTDNGMSWELLPLKGRLPVVASSAEGESIVTGTLDGETFRLQSRGGAWVAGSAGGVHFTALMQIRPGVLVAGASLYGTFRSTDGGATWEKANRGMNSARVGAIAVAPNGTIFAGGEGRYGGFVYMSTDNGATWEGERPEPAPRGVWCMAALPDGTVMAGTEGTGIYRTTDNGATWNVRNSGLTNLTIRSLAVKPNGTVLAGTQGAGVFVSTDRGETWTRTTLDRFQYWSLAVHPDGTLLAGASNGPIHYSSDDGATWTSVSGFGSTTDVQALSVARDGSVYAATFTSGVFRSTNAGRRWFATPMTDRLLFAAVSTPNGETYIGGRGGVRRTIDGIEWDTVNSGAGNVSVESLARDSSGRLLAGATGQGLYRSSDAVASAPAAITRGSSVSLRVLPNPVSAGSTIRLSLKQREDVRLCVYDLPGRLRATLHEGSLPAGEHDIPWIDGLEAGEYCCVLNGSVAVRVRVR